MKRREAQFLKFVHRVADPLDIEFKRVARNSYRLRLLKSGEVLIDIPPHSLDRLQYELARAIVAIKRAKMVREFKWRKQAP